MATTFVFVVALFLGSVYPSTATVYTVGETSGWTLGMDYTNWVDGKSFLPGDSLVFNYAAGMHNVVEVTSADYSTCSATNPLMSDGSGSTTSTLTVGSHYYICGIPGHCAAGMKITLSVQPAATAESPPSTPAGFTSPSANSVLLPPSTPLFTSPPADSGNLRTGGFMIPPFPPTNTFTSPSADSGCITSPETYGTNYPFPGTPEGTGSTGNYPGSGYGNNFHSSAPPATSPATAVLFFAVGLLTLLFPLF